MKECTDIVIKSMRTDNDIKIITLERILKPVYCPKCGKRMHSQGVYTRHIDRTWNIKVLKGGDV